MTTLTRNHDILTAEVKAHIEADALVRGEYWNGSKGCFIGCLTHSSDPKPAFERFGLPVTLMRIAENIFEDLPDDEGIAFFAALPDTVGCDGKDLSRVHWSFLASELRTLPHRDVIDTVIAGINLLVAGEEWLADAAYAAAHTAYATYAAHITADVARSTAYAARSAAYAAYAAAVRAADDAAADAANAAAYAADAAASYAADAAAYAAAVRAADDAASRIRQRDTLLRLISEAPMGDE